MEGRLEKLVEIYEVVERRGGSVYKTRYITTDWVGFNDTPPDRNTHWVSPSSHYNGKTVRRNKEWRASDKEMGSER